MNYQPSLFAQSVYPLRDDIAELVAKGGIEPKLAEVLIEAGLDHNRQGIALRRLAVQDSPTVAWFRGVCTGLALDQSTEGRKPGMLL